MFSHRFQSNCAPKSSLKTVAHVRLADVRESFKNVLRISWINKTVLHYLSVTVAFDINELKSTMLKLCKTDMEESGDLDLGNILNSTLPQH